MLRILTLVTLCQIGAACVSSTGIGDACKCDFTPENGVAGGKNTASGATYNFACNTGYVSDGGRSVKMEVGVTKVNAYVFKLICLCPLLNNTDKKFSFLFCCDSGTNLHCYGRQQSVSLDRCSSEILLTMHLHRCCQRMFNVECL